MRVLHKFKRCAISKELSEGSDNFLLSNRDGGYISFSTPNKTKYQGVWFNDHYNMYKVIENLDLPEKVVSVENHFSHIVRRRETFSEIFFMPHGKNAFVYELTTPQQIELMLDCRRGDDYREWGRNYSVEEDGSLIIIRYEKRSHRNEDNGHGAQEYELFLIIKADHFGYELIDKYEVADYSYDKERKSRSRRHIYRALSLNTSKVVFAYGTDELKVREELASLEKNLPALKAHVENIDYNTRFMPLKKELKVAYYAAQYALKSLTSNIEGCEGIQAGHYWFPEFWARDELISVGAFISLEHYAFVKGIITRYVENIQPDGTLPNRMPASKINSIDAIGWLFKRVDDLITSLLKKGVLNKYYGSNELIALKNRLEQAVLALNENYVKAYLLRNGSKETWMDTEGPDGKGRAGFRIELQALYINMYRTLKHLSQITNDKIGLELSEQKEAEIGNKIREQFWNGHYLNDGANDETIRPNIFLAHYIYPDLLSKSQWIRCFNNMLPRLWLEWGGISSLDKHSPHFVGMHSGEDNKSYHNGDSWYFINNITAIVLNNVSRFRYKSYIKKLVGASITDMLWQGILGMHSEISSANKQEAKGCWNQAWSNATFIELVDSVF